MTGDRWMCRRDLARQGEQGTISGDWDCVVIDAERIQVESICSDEDLAAAGLHCFQVFFTSGSGRCFITAGEALRVRALSARWVRRALLNLAASYGGSWVEHALSSHPGLLLHYYDADEPREIDRAGAESAIHGDSNSAAGPTHAPADFGVQAVAG